MSQHFIKVGRRRVVVASDGGAFDGSNSILGWFRKLFPAGQHSLIGFVGLLRLQDEDVASQIEQLSLRESLQDRPRQLLSALCDEVFLPWGKLVEAYRSQFAWVDPNAKNLFVAFCVSRTPVGEMDLFELKIPFDGEAIGNPELIVHFENLQPRGPIAYCMGHDHFAGDSLEWLNPDLPDQRVISSIDQAIGCVRTVSTSFRVETSERFDVAAIDAGGTHWLRRSM